MPPAFIFGGIMLDEIVTAEASSYGNPHNGMEWFTMRWYGAVFNKDFGPWPKGHKAYTLTFCPITGVVTETDQDDHLIQTCKVELTHVIQ